MIEDEYFGERNNTGRRFIQGRRYFRPGGVFSGLAHIAASLYRASCRWGPFAYDPRKRKRGLLDVAVYPAIDLARCDAHFLGRLAHVRLCLVEVIGVVAAMISSSLMS